MWENKEMSFYLMLHAVEACHITADLVQPQAAWQKYRAEEIKFLPAPVPVFLKYKFPPSQHIVRQSEYYRGDFKQYVLFYILCSDYT